MTVSLIGLQRLSRLLVTDEQPVRPQEAAAHIGLIQAQDYLGALWAVGLRLQGSTEKHVEQSLASRQFIRTWPARGTLHFVAAADVRWMLALLTPRVLSGSAGRFRRLELDEAVFARSRDVFIDGLQGGKIVSREEMYRLLENQRISTAGQRGIHILWRLAQEGLLCFGPRQGKQHTFVLLDEWLPPAGAAAIQTRDEALAELAMRYFSGHGPASLQDFAWWSGLSLGEAKTGLELVKPGLQLYKNGEQLLWMSASSAAAGEPVPSAYLLPPFDEFLVGYKDRSAVLDPLKAKQINAGGGMLNAVIVFNGLVLGSWKRTLQKETVRVIPAWFSPPDKIQTQAFRAAAQRYAAFLNLSLAPD